MKTEPITEIVRWYDIWQTCWGRVGWRATLVPDGFDPFDVDADGRFAAEPTDIDAYHFDVVQAPSKRAAVKIFLRTLRQL